jgi:hypothetical protein
LSLEFLHGAMSGLTTDVELLPQPGDVHGVAVGEVLQGSILRERHAHPLEGLIHVDLEVVLCSPECNE